MADKIVNYTYGGNRRMECIVGISYDADIDQARSVILESLKDWEYAVSDPAPSVTVAELGDSSVNLVVRPWVDSMKYAPASHDLNERVKKALYSTGIGIPFPQRDIHIISGNV